MFDQDGLPVRGSRGAGLIPSCIHTVIEGLRNANPSPPAPLPEGEGGQRPGEGIARLNVSFCSHLGLRCVKTLRFVPCPHRRIIQCL
ncbi:MAG: hypothetical protein DMG05_28860 [Acidobacteria bacterium]|nr:MAG: hypothetical protein DMG05_28860 [Acidobacteriota bacterium]